MKVAIIGTHGIPAKYGGFETFAENISLLLVKNGHEVIVQCDTDTYEPGEFMGVTLFYSTVAKSRNPLRFYYEGLKISLKESDIIIMAGVGGSLFYFLNTITRKVILTNPDGIESNRLKWPAAHKVFLKLSERLAMKLSDFIIADSEAIKEHLTAKYKLSGRKIRIIEYGAPVVNGYDENILRKYDLQFGQYYLVVSRLEPENNIRMIIDGYLATETDKKLIIIGSLSDNRYVTQLIKDYQSCRIRFLGGIYDKSELSTIRFACKAYFHGHSVGGTNPSLLEAMGCGNITICHDNVFNREVTAGRQLYFKNSDQCKEIIDHLELIPPEQVYYMKESNLKRIRNLYNWDAIYEKYNALFMEIAARNKK